MVIAGTKLASSVDSRYTPTECLITGGSVKERIDAYSSCYYPTWVVYASERGGTIKGNCLTHATDAEQELAQYNLSAQYLCFIQVGENTAAPLFVWPGSSMLNVTTERIVLYSVIIAISGVCILTHLILLPFSLRRTRKDDEKEPEESRLAHRLITLSRHREEGGHDNEEIK